MIQAMSSLPNSVMNQLTRCFWRLRVPSIRGWMTRALGDRLDSSRTYNQSIVAIIVSALEVSQRERLKSVKQRIAEEEFDLEEYEIDDAVEEELRENVWEMTGEGGETVSELLDSTAYLEYASHEELINYFKANPEQFFDGVVWSRAYSDLESDRLQDQSVRKFSGFLKDVVMLATDAAEYNMAGLRKTKRIELERAAKSLQMLEAEASLART